VPNLSNNRSRNQKWKKFAVVVSFNSENSTKVGKFANDSDVSRMALTTIKKHNNQIISYFFRLRLYVKTQYSDRKS